MRLAVGAPILAALALAVGACGESDEEKAMNTVCDARDDMAKQVDAGAQGNLSDDRRSEVEAATKQFTDSVKTVVSDLGTSLSASDAKAQLANALQRLGTSYQQTFAPVDCG
jgi:hypothetical protein